MNIKDIGPALRAERKRAGWKQKQIAEDAKITQGYLSQIEKGHKLPSLPVLQDIVSAIGIDLEVLFVRPYLERTLEQL